MTCRRAKGSYSRLCGTMVLTALCVRFVNVDAAVLSALQGFGGLLLIFFIYDIVCQWMIYLLRRMSALRPTLDGLVTLSPNSVVNLPRMLFGVPRWHELAHEAPCRFLFGLRYLPGTGQTDGEAQERTWALLNGLALRTREMASGHRHDTINDFHDYTNERRMRIISECLGDYGDTIGANL